MDTAPAPLRYHVNAFTGHDCRGNPAAVMLLPRFPQARIMQAHAAASCSPATAFGVIGDAGSWQLRWFSPQRELQLCGHATLATARVLLDCPGAGIWRRHHISFQTSAGILDAFRHGHQIGLQLPAIPATAIDRPPDDLFAGLGVMARNVYRADNGNYLVLLEAPSQVRDLQPDFALLSRLDGGIIVTAPGADTDFVSRFFIPCAGTNEDHATGSAHCTLAPWWSARLGRRHLSGHQLSARGGRFDCHLTAHGVYLLGQTRLRALTRGL